MTKGEKFGKPTEENDKFTTDDGQTNVTDLATYGGTMSGSKVGVVGLIETGGQVGGPGGGKHEKLQSRRGQ